MTMKVAFENFLKTLLIAPSQQFHESSAPEFGDAFFHFARANGYDISNNANRVLTAAKLDADEVIDVGVHDGTPWLYRQFANAKFILVEPQKYGVEMVKELPASYKFVNAALGAEPGQLVLKEHKEKTSLLRRTDIDMRPEDEYEVPVLTLDHIIEEHCRTQNIGLKIDTEGFEYDVLRGLDTHKERISFLIMEISVRSRYSGEKTFSEIVSLALEKGFHFYNIMNTARPTPPNAYDVLFLRPEHPNFAA